MSRGPYRRHSAQFKLQLCHDIRSGTIGRKEAQRKYSLSANLVHLWLTQYDRGELDAEEVEAAVLTEYEAKIAALERKVGQLTMELDLLKGMSGFLYVRLQETALPGRLQATRQSSQWSFQPWPASKRSA